MSTMQHPVGEQLRDWRMRRRLSQLDLALDAEISTRHLSFVETGKSQPSREMILKLAERLDVPLREQNTLLLAGGFAPIYQEQALESPTLMQACSAIQRILSGHEPYPAVAVDRHWELIAFNQSIGLLLQDVAPSLLDEPVNVLRVSLHPDGVAPRILNLPEWRAHLLQRLDRQIAHTADPVLIEMREEMAGYPAPPLPVSTTINALLVPLVLRTSAGVLRFFSTTTIFGTPMEITLSELAIESFFPADDATARILHHLSPRSSS